MKKIAVFILVEIFNASLLMAMAIGGKAIANLFWVILPMLLFGFFNLVVGFLLGNLMKTKRAKKLSINKERPPEPCKKRLSKEEFRRAFDIEGPGWVRTGWKLFPPGSIFSLIQHFHIFLHLQISFVLGNYFSNLLLHLFFFG